MNDKKHGSQDPDVRDKLSATMRIDIAPEVESELQTQDKAARRFIAKRQTRRVLTKAAPSEGMPPALGNKDFQELFQSVYDAAVITDLEGNVVDLNVRASGFLLYEPDELRSMSILDIISGADASLIETIRKNLVQRFILIEACYCARKDGTYFPAEIAVNELQFSQQDFLCFFVRDTTRRREAEEKLRVVSNAIANSHSGIAITGMDGIIQYVNPAVCQIWKYDEEADVLGKDVRSLWRTADAEDNLLQSITTQEQAWIREITAVRKDGSEFDVQIIAASNRDTDGRLVGVVFSFVDISDRKRAEKALRESERQKVMLESLGAACHHLGQPATVLLANLGIMERKVDTSDPGVKQMMKSLIDAAESLSEILHRLNAINEYRTTPYLADKSGDGTGSRILEI